MDGTHPFECSQSLPALIITWLEVLSINMKKKALFASSNASVHVRLGILPSQKCLLTWIAIAYRNLLAYKQNSLVSSLTCLEWEELTRVRMRGSFHWYQSSPFFRANNSNFPGTNGLEWNCFATETKGSSTNYYCPWRGSSTASPLFSVPRGTPSIFEYTFPPSSFPL